MPADTASMDQKPFWLTGNFAPVREEITETELEVIGAIPPELNGRFFRNGANPHVDESSDWFFGTGMIHGVRLKNGKAEWYRNRYTKTPLLDVPGMVTRDMTVVPENSFANTHVVGHGGKVLALQESHKPYELTMDLETVGMYDFDGKLTSTMTAHPKTCPKTGEMIAFGYSFIPPFLTYIRVSPEGELVQSEEIDIGRSVMQHDFNMTRNYVIFMDLPMVFDLAAAMSGKFPLSYKPETGARLGVMLRNGTNADVKWFDIEPCYVYHSMNAYEHGDEISIDVCRMDGYEGIGMENPPIPNLHRWTLNLKTGHVSERKIDDLGVDFPRVSPSVAGLKNRYGYTAEFGTDGVPTIAAYHKYDMDTGAKTSHRLGDGRMGAEAVFIPADGATSEDEGYLMTFIYDAAANKSELVIMDASQMSSPPIARVHLPVRVPFGFHGSWIPDAA